MRQFYTEVLAAEPLDRSFPTGLSFGGTTIDFFVASDQQHPSPGTDHHAYIIAIALQDFDAWTGQLREHGVSVSFANFSKTRMSMLFDDPDGYHFEFVVPMGSKEVAVRELEKRGIQPRHGGTQTSWPTAPR